LGHHTNRSTSTQFDSTGIGARADQLSSALLQPLLKLDAGDRDFSPNGPARFGERVRSSLRTAAAA
jgi:hypothetical protein